MKYVVLIVTIGLFVTSAAIAQGVGSVSGVVYDEDNNPVSEAYVHLTEDGWHGGGGHGHHHHGENYFAETGEDGTFMINDVAAGEYTAIASKMGIGHDSEIIDVVAGQNTEVEFVLEMGGYDGGGMHGDSLEIVELSGWAIVEEEDSLMTHYYLDTEHDGQADYRMLFGPYWYDPDSGAQRPADGDSIWVVAGIMGYSVPQPIVIYEINGLFWREPGDGHGGYGGDGDCPYPDSVDLVEVNGQAMVEGMPHMNMYFLDEDFDSEEDYALNFGAPWYDPGNGATRPNDGDTVSIVGGLMEGCMNWPMIVVYEINGQFWREPGDTTGIGPIQTDADDNGQQIPDDFIIASAYPNPFNSSTIIYFELPREQHVEVSVYDILGRQIGVLADNVFPAGGNEVVFDLNKYGGPGSAVYFYRVSGENSRAIGKVIYLK